MHRVNVLAADNPGVFFSINRLSEKHQVNRRNLLGRADNKSLIFIKIQILLHPTLIKSIDFKINKTLRIDWLYGGS